MPNRLKAAWRVLFSEQYIVATVQKDSDEVETDMACSHAMTSTLALHCIQVAAEAIEKRNMNHLVSEAQAILEKKV